MIYVCALLDEKFETNFDGDVESAKKLSAALPAGKSASETPGRVSFSFDLFSLQHYRGR